MVVWEREREHEWMIIDYKIKGVGGGGPLVETKWSSPSSSLIFNYHMWSPQPPAPFSFIFLFHPILMFLFSFNNDGRQPDRQSIIKWCRGINDNPKTRDADK